MLVKPCIRRYTGAARRHYVNYYGDIPNNYVIHHLCENPWCVEPLHLVALIQGVHVRIHILLLAGHKTDVEIIIREEALPKTKRSFLPTNERLSYNRLLKRGKVKRANAIVRKYGITYQDNLPPPMADLSHSCELCQGYQTCWRKRT